MGFPAYFRRILPLMLALASAPFVLAQSVTPEIKSQVLASMGRIVTTQAFAAGADFSKWPEFLEEAKEQIDSAETPDAFAAAVNGALRRFGFSHILLHTPRQAMARVEGRQVGIGVRIFPHEDGLLVTDVIQGGPAQEAGIEPRDILLEANGVKIEGTEQVAGEEGTTVVLKVRKESGEIKEYSIVRRPFSTVIPESIEWPTPETALVRIPTFDLAYNRERVEGIFKEVHEKGAKNLILDLRGNGGGAVIHMFHLLNFLLPPDVEFGTFVNRQQVDQFAKETDGDPKDVVAVAAWASGKLRTWRTDHPRFEGRIAVLVNGASGSASEIVAAALKERGKATLLGSRTAGAVLASMIRPLVHGYQLQFPVTDYVSIEGLRIEGKGVPVDHEVPTPRPFENDPAVAKAVEVLTTLARTNG